MSAKLKERDRAGMFSDGAFAESADGGRIRESGKTGWIMSGTPANGEGGKTDAGENRSHKENGERRV